MNGHASIFSTYQRGRGFQKHQHLALIRVISRNELFIFFARTIIDNFNDKSVLTHVAGLRALFYCRIVFPFIAVFLKFYSSSCFFYQSVTVLPLVLTDFQKKKTRGSTFKKSWTLHTYMPYIYPLFNLEFRVAKDKLVSSSYKYDYKYY